MNSKKKIEKYKRFYENGFWTKKMVATLVYDGKLTPEAYEEITGEIFVEKEEYSTTPRHPAHAGMGVAIKE